MTLNGDGCVDALRSVAVCEEERTPTEHMLPRGYRCRERDFLKKVHHCVSQGGNVLIPVFALGRAQELCILLGELR